MSHKWSEALEAQLGLIRWFRSDNTGWLEGYRVLAKPGAAFDDFEARVARYLAAFGAGTDTQEDLEGMNRLVEESGRPQAELVAAWLNSADTYWVSPEMSRFLLHAHQDIPHHSFSVEDLPSPHGFVFFAEPLMFSGPDGDVLLREVRFLVWGTRLYGADHPAAGRSELVISVWAGPRGPKRAEWLASTSGDLDGTAEWSSLDRLAHAFWALSQQRIAKATQMPVERHTRKRAERAGFAVPEDGIRVVTLRRPATDTPASGQAHHLVDWSHRWIVSGHWRDQWYPSDETHRPKWIEPYEKGPDDKPLVIKDRVYKWVR